MPTSHTSAYRPPLLGRGPHWETILPNLTRRRIRVAYRRARLELPDGDFVDLDTLQARSPSPPKGALLALHGLEGSSRAPYVKSFARAAARRGWDCVALNFRGCSGELNRLPRFYHSGETGDLQVAIAYLRHRYRRIGLVGFSLGGNVILKHLGEDAAAVDAAVFGAVAYSAPIDLAGSARRIAERENALYMKRFIRLLSAKIERKAQVFPETISASGARAMRSFAEFDEAYTAPLGGFASAEDYWRRCSALNRLDAIQIPSLLVAARNDPFLSPLCYPQVGTAVGAVLHSVFPEHGGHIGFPGWRIGGEAWHERVGLDFMEAQLADRRLQP